MNRKWLHSLRWISVYSTRALMIHVHRVTSSYCIRTFRPIDPNGFYNIRVVSSPIVFYQLRNLDRQQINHKIYIKLRYSVSDKIFFYGKGNVHTFNLLNFGIFLCFFNMEFFERINAAKNWPRSSNHLRAWQINNWIPEHFMVL